MKRTLALFAGLLVIASLTSCGSAEKDTEDKLRAALRRTERLSRSLSYTERSDDGQTEVNGVIEDDYRYKMRVSFNGSAVIDEVARDDALAVRFPDPAGAAQLFFTRFERQQAARGAGGGGAPSGGGGRQAFSGGFSNPIQRALAERRWVLDAEGAPEIAIGDRESLKVGLDPVLDALTIFAYVDQAINEALEVLEFSPESTQYNPNEDVFPTPAPDSPVTRYDLEPPKVPSPTEGGVAGQRSLPGKNHFRRMSIYVKDGLVVQIREDIDVVHRLDEIRDKLDIKLPNNRETIRDVALTKLNEFLQTQGGEPIRTRRVLFELLELGKPQSVSLPSEVVPGSLSILPGRGRQARPAASPSGGGAGGSTSVGESGEPSSAAEPAQPSPPPA